MTGISVMPSLRDIATVLIDCGLRPEECARLRWEHVRDGAVHVPFGKTENARRTIPLTQRLTWPVIAISQPPGATFILTSRRYEMPWNAHEWTEWAQFRGDHRRPNKPTGNILMKTGRIFGRGEWIRTTDLLVPNQAL
jgi:integrase